MGPSLFSLWMEKELIDPTEALICHGIRGVLAQFENWLDRNGLTVSLPRRQDILERIHKEKGGDDA